MKLDTLSVHGYKSIRVLDDFQFRDLNVLIGANGAGKSNLISLFRLLAAVAEGNLQSYVQKQGGPDALLFGGRKRTSGIEAVLLFEEGGLRVSLEPTLDNRLVFRDFTHSKHNRVTVFGFIPNNNDSEVKIAEDDPILQSLRSWRVYHFHDTSDTAAVKGQHPSNDNLRLKPDAANLAAYLARLHEEHPKSYQRIVETIRLAAPFFENFVIRDPLPKTVELEWTERGDPDTPYRAHVLSDGTLRFVCLTTLLLQPRHLQPDTLLIDEPELGLHPYAINLLSEMLKEAAQQKQIIVSTQSVALLNTFAPEDVIVAEREDGASIFKRLNRVELKEWLEDYSLGELWERNILGGRPTR